MRASVVIVSYRPNRWLAPALASVVDQADEVVLVDNGSADGEASAIGGTLGATVVRADQNLGFAGGVNLGLRRATGDVLALLNDDAVAEPGWLERSTDALEDPGVAAVAPKLLLAPRYAELRFDDDPYDAPNDARELGRMLRSATVDGRDVLPHLLGGVHRLERGELAGAEQRWRWTSGRDAVFVPLDHDGDAGRIVVDGEAVQPVQLVDLVNNAGSYLSQEGHVGDHGWETPDVGQFDEPRDCFAACGAAMAFTRSTYEAIGELAERFFAYYEDVDWCWRAQLGGRRVRYEPSAVVRHARGATTGGETNRRTRLLSGRNRLHTLARNAPLRTVRRQVGLLRHPDVPSEIRRSARARTLEGLVDRVRLRRGWRRTPDEVWDAWAGVGEQWEDPGRSGPRVQLPPGIQFGD